VTTEQTPFELNFGRYPWKSDLVVQTEFPRLEEFYRKARSRPQNRWKKLKRI